MANTLLGLEVAGLLTTFLEARVVGAFQIVLDDPCDAVDRTDREILVQNLDAIIPSRRQLEPIA